MYVLQGGAQGRLLSYNPNTGITQVLAENIWQANGVAVSHDETFVVIASTPSMRLFRYWLKGSKVRISESAHIKPNTQYVTRNT